MAEKVNVPSTPRHAHRKDTATKDNPGKVTAAFQLRSQGLGFKAIAKKLGVSKNSVKKWIRDPKFV